MRLLTGDEIRRIRADQWGRHEREQGRRRHAKGGYVKAAGGGGSLSYVTGGAGPMAVPTFGFHSGGIVGMNPTFVRDVPAAAFADAPRFHTGGIFGPRERPAVLELGEEVLRRDDPRHTFNGGRRALGDTITASLSPVFNIDAKGSNMTREQIQQIAAATVTEWWKTSRGDVVNVVREARAGRVKGV